MKGIGNTTIFFEAIESELAGEGDPPLWKAALSVLADDLALRTLEKVRYRVWAMVVGACSHWVRPHNSRWNAAGGFVYPAGYKDHVHELNWSVIFVSQDNKWTSALKLPGKTIDVFRVAIPKRTARHKQAAIYTRWTPNGEVVLYQASAGTLKYGTPAFVGDASEGQDRPCRYRARS